MKAASLLRDLDIVRRALTIQNEKPDWQKSSEETVACLRMLEEYDEHLEAIGLEKVEITALQLGPRLHIEEMYASEQFSCLRNSWLSLYDSATQKLKDHGEEYSGLDASVAHAALEQWREEQREVKTP